MAGAVFNKSRYYVLLLLVMTIACGCGFLYAILDLPTLEFHHLGHSMFPASSFQTRRGFVNVLRWLESLNSREDIVVLGQQLTQAKLHAAKKQDFPALMASAAEAEMTIHLCKLGLQCGLVLFLYRRRVLSKNQTIPTFCLCIISFLCWKMAQTCLYKMLAPYRNSTDSAPRTKAFARDEVTASFLNALFAARYGSMSIVNLIFSRAYQVFLCEPWPTSWKRIPAYFGSKNLVLGTLFFAVACVSAMSVLSPALRSLCEAATQIEALGLAIAFGHFVFMHFDAKDEESKAND